MTRERSAAPSGEQREPVAQAVEDLLNAQDAGPDRGKLDRQRQAVEPPAEAATAAAFDVVSSKAPDAAAARSVNSMTASFCRS